jgi:hypothetical protein
METSINAGFMGISPAIFGDIILVFAEDYVLFSPWGIHQLFFLFFLQQIQL